MEVKSNPDLLTVKDLAQRLSLAERTVWRHADSGKIPRPVKIGASVRWKRTEIEKWLDAGCPCMRRSTGRVGR